MSIKARVTTLLLTMLLVTAGAQAADDMQGGTARDEDQAIRDALIDGSSGWSLGGGLAVTDPGYVGQTRRITPIPEFFYHRGRLFFAGFSAGYLLDDGRHYRFSLLVKPQLNRLHPGDDPQLQGIQTREWSLDGGAKLSVFGDWGRFRIGAFHDLLDRNNGTQVDAGYEYSFHLGDWRFTPGIGARWENANLTSYYYGVSAAEAIPGRPAYSPGSAVDPYVSIGLSTSISEHWRFHGSLEYTRFGSAIHDSPIVDRSGSPTLFIGFTYSSEQRSWLGGESGNLHR